MHAIPPHPASAEELQELLEWLHENPSLWRERMRFDEADRVYVSLGGNEHVEVWLICWINGQDTGFHDHAGSVGAAIVVEGEISEQLLADSGPGDCVCYANGSRMNFAAGHRHRMFQTGSKPTATLHAYSPPILTVGRYSVTEDGIEHSIEPRDAARFADGWNLPVESNVKA